MRVKTVPRHRIIQNNIRTTPATTDPSDEENVEDIEKNYYSNVTDNLYQVSINGVTTLICLSLTGGLNVLVIIRIITNCVIYLKL